MSWLNWSFDRNPILKAKPGTFYSFGMTCPTVLMLSNNVYVAFSTWTNGFSTNAAVNLGVVGVSVGETVDALTIAPSPILTPQPGTRFSGSIYGARFFRDEGTNYCIFAGQTNTLHPFENPLTTNGIFIAWNTDGNITNPASWSYQTNPLVVSGEASWNSYIVYQSAMLRVGDIYHLFANGATNFGGLATESVGHWTSSSPRGPFTADPANPVFTHANAINGLRITGNPYILPMDDGGYAMFCSDNLHGNVRLAHSYDLTHWTEYSKSPLNIQGVINYPNIGGYVLGPEVFYDGMGWRMLVAGQGITIYQALSSQSTATNGELNVSHLMSSHLRVDNVTYGNSGHTLVSVSLDRGTDLGYPSTGGSFQMPNQTGTGWNMANNNQFGPSDRALFFGYGNAGNEIAKVGFLKDGTVTAKAFKSGNTNSVILKGPSSSWILRVADDGTLTTVTNASGL